MTGTQDSDVYDHQPDVKSTVSVRDSDSAATIFDALPGLYSLFRERLFADHTDLILPVLMERGIRSRGVFLEVGCGPGFYARRIASQLPEWTAIGIDSSQTLIEIARSRAEKERLSNCSFLKGDLVRASDELPTADVILISRLLLVLTERELAVKKLWHALAPGGHLIICEPSPGLRTAIPAICMKIAAVLLRRRSGSLHSSQRALSENELTAAVETVEWHKISRWKDFRYRYVLCEK